MHAALKKLSGGDFGGFEILVAVSVKSHSQDSERSGCLGQYAGPLYAAKSSGRFVKSVRRHLDCFEGPLVLDEALQAFQAKKALYSLEEAQN